LDKDTELSADVDPPPTQRSPRNSSSTPPDEDEIGVSEKDLERDRKFEEFYEDQILASQEDDAPSDTESKTESRTESLISKDSYISISEASSSDDSSSEGETSSDSSNDGKFCLFVIHFEY